MTTKDFIIELFYRIDEELKNVEKHPQPLLYPSEVVTIAFLFCLKGVENRAFYRWLEKDYRSLFPQLPERTRLFRLFLRHRDLTNQFLANPSVLGVIDAYAIELIHPIREGRSEKQIGKKGLLNYRWIVGGKISLLVNQDGLVVAWDSETANSAVCDEEEKSAELFIEGENLEVDTQILDSLIEPLLHLLRNAVAHGIEPPETRRMLGKSESGKISLRLSSEGTHIVLTVADDGRGISVSALKDKAVNDGFISKEKASAMTDAEVLELAFLPGLTTAEKLSQVSGRGVGLNIVKTGIARHQGTILIASELQKGTTFTIRLPMALAVTRAILVKANHQTFVFPLKLVKHITDISAKHLEKNKKSVQLGDVNYKVWHLTELLNMPVASVSTNPNIPLLLIETLENPCALIVDEIIKTEEIVIKPLGNPLQNLTELLGATILGDGSIVPVLDVIHLLKAQLPTSNLPNSDTPQTKDKEQRKKNKGLTILIVDDSPSVRQLTSNIIKNVGWTAIVAKDGLEALEMLEDSDELPDIILTDVEMPRMNGYELLASLKRQENLQAIPIIIITSRASQKHRQKVIDLGISDYLTKPFEDTKLVEIINNLTQPSSLP